jgi:hypothetical protein
MNTTTKNPWGIAPGGHVGWPARVPRDYNLQDRDTFKTPNAKVLAALEAAHSAKINADYAKRLAGDPFYANHDQ